MQSTLEYFGAPLSDERIERMRDEMHLKNAGMHEFGDDEVASAFAAAGELLTDDLVGCAKASSFFIEDINNA